MATKNKSLSARIKRRNAQGFKGEGSQSDFVPRMPGDYTNERDNHKQKDRILSQAKKQKLALFRGFYGKCLRLKYANNKQKS